MKLRVHGNDLRLRLTRSEVRRLAAGEAIEEACALPPVPLVYRISSVDGAKIAATFDGGAVAVVVPRDLACAWAMSDDVGIETELPAARGDAPVRVLVEKDFQCLHGGAGAAAAEDDADCFKNPRAVVG